MAYEDYINGPHDDEDDNDEKRSYDLDDTDTIEIYDPRSAEEEDHEDN